MRRHCPRCERRTYYQRRTGDFREPIPAGYLSATTQDGTCTTGWRVLHNTHRPTAKGLVATVSPIYRHALTDEEIMQARVGLVQFWTSRRRRGIPTEGLHPEAIQRPGLTLLEA